GLVSLSSHLSGPPDIGIKLSQFVDHFSGGTPGFRIPPERAVPDAEKVEEENPAEGMALIRTIFAALLYELSVVTRPAYDETQIEERNWQPDRLILPVRVHPSARWRA
ncbi:prohead serine protease, partial [Roseivivax halotolerans]